MRFRSEKTKQTDKKYRLEHAAEILARSKAYYRKHKEERNVYYKEWLKENKEKVRNYKTEWAREDRKKNPERIRATASRCRLKNIEKIHAFQRAHHQTPKGKYSMYKRASKRRGGAGNFFNITFDEFMTFWQKPCSYCNDEIKTVGLDRVNNDIGYIMLNLISCCHKCNIMKHTQTQEQFFSTCEKITKNNIKRLESLYKEEPQCPL